ncbi:hypothetical protein ABZX85_19005 [Streptomyces sp. NPDC004539]|uniref:hypothetical protein n=1 Tax=Streptomyces sp. NPDC004539 TaxID=3154280 RepID=UPI0033A345B8
MPKGGAKARAGIDATTRMWPDLGTVRAGESFGIWAIAENIYETTPTLALKFVLPEGVKYVGNLSGQTNATCEPAGERTLTCLADDGNTKQVMAKIEVKADDDLPPMTDLTFTSVADIGDSVDTNPANNRTDSTVTVMVKADVGVEWRMEPAGPVAAGTAVRTVFTVTNHGPGYSRSGTVKFYPGFDYWPAQMPPYPPCWVDPGVIVCDFIGDMAPGQTLTYAFTWKFPAKAAGTTYRVLGELYTPSRHDPVSANDKAEAVFRIVKGSGTTPSPTPTPSSGATPSSSPTPVPTPSGGGLAETGAGGVGAVLWGAVGAVVLGGGLFGAVWARARRRALDE